jgi:Family of unknown function (DUF6069)
MAKGRITGARREVATHPVRRQRLLTVAGGTLGALAVWAVAEWVVGLDLRTPASSSGQQPQELNAAVVAAASAVGGLAGWGVLAVLERLQGLAFAETGFSGCAFIGACAEAGPGSSVEEVADE